MTLVDERIYRFESAAHWDAGARRNLELHGDRLVVPDELVVEPIPGAGAAEGGALPALDACGHLMWLRPWSRELVRRPSEGSRAMIELGTLDGPAPARRMAAGRTIIWVLAGQRLDRYDASTLQRLSPAEPRPGWRVRDAAGDGADGLWLAEADPSGRGRLRHVDCWGRSCRGPIAVAGPDGGELSIASTTDGAWLVVIDPIESAAAIVVDAARGEVVRTIGLDPVHRGRPTLLSAAPDNRIHLLTMLDGGHVVYQVMNLTDGDVEDHQDLEVPRRLGRPTALAGGPAGLVVSCSRGLAEIVPREGMAEERWSTFITPALVSPLGPRSGWNRAEVDVVLPTGTAMEVTWASTDHTGLIDRAARLFAGPATAGLVDELEEALPWREEEVTYRGTGGDGVEQLAALLDRVEETTLWLRIRLHTPPGRTSPELVGLRVRYPDASYLDDLPAVYRENPLAAGELRRILAPYEVLFDGLDQVLASLPDRIDPNTADDGWTDYLLGWLGFPPLGDLPAGIRCELLKQAAVILEWRGMHKGLELLLDIVTEGRASVTDIAEEPVGWFLGVVGEVPSVGAAPARLGYDTLAVGQQPEPSRPGSLVVGRTPLGQGSVDPGLTLAQRASTITVRLELQPERQQTLKPIIDRLLPVFVPAHCRVRLVYTRADADDRSRQLDVDFRLGPEDPAAEAAQGQSPYDAQLHSDAHWRLGATTWLSGWSLPEPTLRAAVLDHGAPLGAGQRLH